MANRKTRIAIIYDFDRTLSTSEMQDGFIRSLGMEPKEFWGEVGKYAKDHSMDSKLAYLYLMVSECKKRNKPLNRDILKEFGKDVEFYKGVEKWFDAVNMVGKEHDVIVNHYLISAGLLEMIEGTSIYRHFEKVFACEFLYDENNVPIWVKNVVNFTSKTQFIFRINKGELDISDENGVNEYRPHDERPYPFENMIYIGDGTTDIPCMKLVKGYGGHSIGVYDKSRDKVSELMYDERINFVCKADYSEGGELFKRVSDIIGMISYDDKLRKRESRDYREARKRQESKKCETMIDISTDEDN